MTGRIMVWTEIWVGREHDDANVYRLNVEIENQGDPTDEINEEAVVEEIKAMLIRWATSWIRPDVQVSMIQTRGAQK